MKVKKKMNFKACVVRETGVYSDVNEDFEHKRNEEIRFFFTFSLRFGYDYTITLPHQSHPQ